MNIEFLNPPQLCPTFGWTHVVSATGGKTIHISGQVGINERGEVVGRGDLKAQTEQAFHNISLALAAVGATFRDVVKTSLFVVDSSRSTSRSSAKSAAVTFGPSILQPARSLVSRHLSVPTG